MAAKKLLDAERKAAAKRAKDLGMVLGAAASGFPGDVPLPGIQGPGGVPHYFGPYGNWAFSPLPKGPVTAVTVTSGGTGYTNSPTVTIIDAHGTNDNVTVTANVIDGVIDSVDITNPQPAGSNLSFTAPIVIITDSTGTGATAEASIATVPLGSPYPAGVGIRKFVDRLPGLGPSGANLLNTPNRLGAGPTTTDNQYIPVAVSENFATPNLLVSDYYVIGLVEFYEKMHSDLPPTRQRGYVQLETPANAPPTGPSKHVALTYLDGQPIYYPGTNNQVFAVDYPHYLGPIIVAKGRVHGIQAQGADPGEQQRRRFVRLEERLAVPHTDGSLSTRKR